MNFLSLTTVLVATFVLTNASVSVNNPFYCFSQDPIRPQNGMYATQTAYDITRGFMVDPAVSSCTPTKFWLASRHGGRLPDNENLQRMIAFAAGPTQGNIIRNYNAGRTSLCAADFQLIQNWTFDSNITIESHSLLTVAGWNVMQSLAQRYQAAFPTLLPPTYNAQQYFFRHTARQRSEGSIRAFADGLFGFNGFQNVTFETVPTVDSFLRPNDNCPAYTNASTVVPEMDAFENGPEYREMMLQVNTRLGFSGSSQLNSQEIRTMWEFCRFEQGTNLTVASGWCAAFSIANHAVLEYLNDMGYFYRAGYGGAPRRLYENLNCNLMQDMLRYLQSTNPNDQLAKIFGTHSTALQLFLVSLGVFDNASSLNRHNYAQQTFRQWKSSLLTPKGANLAVVRYDCADGDNDVVFYFNERPLVIPGCQTNGLCKVNMILERYSRFLNANCSNLFCSTA